MASTQSCRPIKNGTLLTSYVTAYCTLYSYVSLSVSLSLSLSVSVQSIDCWHYYILCKQASKEKATSKSIKPASKHRTKSRQTKRNKMSSSLSMLPAPPLYYSPLRKVPKAKAKKVPTSPTITTSKTPSSPLLYSNGGRGGRDRRCRNGHGNGVAAAAAAVARARFSTSSSPCTTPPLSHTTTKRKLTFTASSASPSPLSSPMSSSPYPYSSNRVYTSISPPPSSSSSTRKTSLLVLVVTLSVLSIALVSMQVSTIDHVQIRNRLKNRPAAGVVGGAAGAGGSSNRLRVVAVVEKENEQEEDQNVQQVQRQRPPPPPSPQQQQQSSSFSSSFFSSFSVSSKKTVVQQLKDDHKKELLALQQQITNLQERMNELYGPDSIDEVQEDIIDATVRDANIDTNATTSSSAGKNESSSFEQQRQQALDVDDRLLDLSTDVLRKQHGYTSPACTLQLDDDLEDDEDIPVFDRIFFLHVRKAGGSRYVFVVLQAKTMGSVLELFDWRFSFWCVNLSSFIISRPPRLNPNPSPPHIVYVTISSGSTGHTILLSNFPKGNVIQKNHYRMMNSVTDKNKVRNVGMITVIVVMTVAIQR